MKYILIIAILLVGTFLALYVQRTQLVSDIMPLTREEMSIKLDEKAKSKYQAMIRQEEKGDTLWVYLPVSGRRMGLGQVKELGEKLNIDFYINNINPFQPKHPSSRLTFAQAELTYVIQKILKDIRELSLRCARPYKFYVLVVTEANNKDAVTEDWYIMCFDDFAGYPVALDYSGEALKRLTVHKEPVENSYHDFLGSHINFHEITIKEFVEKQIVWRIYQRFSEDYNRTPFNISAAERREVITKIVKDVVSAYGFKEFSEYVLKDESGTEGTDAYDKVISRQDLDNFEPKLKTRLPAF